MCEERCVRASAQVQSRAEGIELVVLNSWDDAEAAGYFVVGEFVELIVEVDALEGKVDALVVVDECGDRLVNACALDRLVAFLDRDAFHGDKDRADACDVFRIDGAVNDKVFVKAESPLEGEDGLVAAFFGCLRIHMEGWYVRKAVVVDVGSDGGVRAVLADLVLDHEQVACIVCFEEFEWLGIICCGEDMASHEIVPPREEVAAVGDGWPLESALNPVAVVPPVCEDRVCRGVFACPSAGELPLLVVAWSGAACLCEAGFVLVNNESLGKAERAEEEECEDAECCPFDVSFFDAERVVVECDKKDGGEDCGDGGKFKEEAYGGCGGEDHDEEPDEDEGVFFVDGFDLRVEVWFFVIGVKVEKCDAAEEEEDGSVENLVRECAVAVECGIRRVAREDVAEDEDGVECGEVFCFRKRFDHVIKKNDGPEDEGVNKE